MRSPGSFQASLEAIPILQEARLQTAVMFTLSRLNREELLAVQRLCDSMGVERFAFDRMVPVGNGAGLKGELLDNWEIKELMVRYMEERSRTRFANKYLYKSHLFNLLREEYGLLEPPADRDHLQGGCAIGRALSILADGRVLMCRRLPLEVGKFPEQSFAQVFIESPLLNRMRERTAEMTRHWVETLTGVRVIRVFNRQEGEAGRLKTRLSELAGIALELERLKGASGGIFSFSLGALSALVWFYGGREVASGQLTLGTLVAFNALVAQVIGPIGRLGRISLGISGALAAAERVFGLLGEESEPGAALPGGGGAEERRRNLPSPPAPLPPCSPAPFQGLPGGDPVRGGLLLLRRPGAGPGRGELRGPALGVGGPGRGERLGKIDPGGAAPAPV